jgi:hypothetical protein
MFVIGGDSVPLQGNGDVRDCFAPRRNTLQASLDHPPHTVGKLRMLRAGRSTTPHHQMNPCDRAFVREWGSPSEHLREQTFHQMTPPQNTARAGQTSKARAPNAYVSLAFVAPVLADRRR